MGPATAAHYVRSLLQIALLESPCVWLADWDQSNAFSGVNREKLKCLDASLPRPSGLGEWADAFYGNLAIRPLTRLGPAPHFRMETGIGAGGPAGPPAFTVTTVPQSLYIEAVAPPDVVRAGVEYVPLHVVDFSDDRKFTALSEARLSQQLNAALVACEAFDGAPQPTKIHAYRGVSTDTGIHMSPKRVTISATMSTGDPQDATTPMFVGAPMEVGRKPDRPLSRMKGRAQRVQRSLRGARAAYRTARTVITVFLLSALDTVRSF